MSNSMYDLTASEKKLVKWEAGEKLQERLRGALILRADYDSKLKKGLTVTDAKSLYDSLDREPKGKEARIALAVAATKQSMEITGQRARWIPHNENIVDGLTKTLQKANLLPLLQLMRTGRMKLKGEGDELAYRKQLKETGGLVRRKGKYLKEMMKDEETQLVTEAVADDNDDKVSEATRCYLQVVRPQSNYTFREL